MTKLYFFNGLIIFLFCFILSNVTPAYSQSRTVRKAIKDKEKLEKQEERAYEKSRKEAIDAHYKRQSDNTKEQMELSKKISKAYRKKNKTGFIEGIVNKREIKKKKKKRAKRQKR